MLIHDKLMSGQFLLDLKSDRSNLLHHATHHLTQQPMHQSNLYSAYTYQQHQLHQQMLVNGVNNQQRNSPSSEVLDLSRRCSVETPPPSELSVTMGLATLYPALYYSSGGVKRETLSSSPILTAPAIPAITHPLEMPSPLPPTQLPAAASSLLQTFATAAATATKIDNGPHSPPPNCAQNLGAHTPTSITTTPTSSITTSSDIKSTTRPFKAFPRDPLVIAANFAATDVLLDNPRVERYTEYRKRVLEQIRNANGGSRTVSNPKMRRTNSQSGSIHDGCYSNNSVNEERTLAEESSDCDSTAGNFDKMTSSTSSNSSCGSATDQNGNTTSRQDTNNNGNISMSSGQIKDAAYYERRRKNNAAAKKSRDRRRIKEDEIAIRAAYLERQNIELLCQIDALKAQLAAFTSKVST